MPVITAKGISFPPIAHMLQSLNSQAIGSLACRNQVMTALMGNLLWAVCVCLQQLTACELDQTV